MRRIPAGAHRPRAIKPCLDLATSEPDRSVVATETHAGNTARLRGVVQPRTRDTEQLDDLAWPEEPNVRMIRTVHVA